MENQWLEIRIKNRGRKLIGEAMMQGLWGWARRGSLKSRRDGWAGRRDEAEGRDTAPMSLAGWWHHTLGFRRNLAVGTEVGERVKLVRI